MDHFPSSSVRHCFQKQAMVDFPLTIVQRVIVQLYRSDWAELSTKLANLGFYRKSRQLSHVNGTFVLLLDLSEDFVVRGFWVGSESVTHLCHPGIKLNDTVV